MTLWAFGAKGTVLHYYEGEGTVPIIRALCGVVAHNPLMQHEDAKRCKNCLRTLSARTRPDNDLCTPEQVQANRRRLLGS